MKHIVLPALSLVLLAAMPAQAQSSAHPFLQIAQNNTDRPHRGGVQPSPAVAPVGSVGNSSAGHGRTTGAGATHSTGGAGHAGAGTGGAATAGGQGAGSRGGRARGNAGGTPATGTPTILGGQRTGTAGGTNHGGAGTGVTGGGQMGGTGSTGSRSRGGAGAIDRTGGGILLPGTPTGGHATGGAATGGDHGHATVFGTRPSNWNQYPRTFDRGTYQRNLSASRHFHWQNYNQPSGYYYRRWAFGQIFPRIFWAQDYWLTDYWMFDLPVPPYGYVWVRYGDDALLINKQTGEVLQAVYGLFD